MILKDQLIRDLQKKISYLLNVYINSILILLFSDSSIALKDLNALEKKFKLILNQSDADKLQTQITKDAIFFENNHLIDYSLLIGVHNVDPNLNS